MTVNVILSEITDKSKRQKYQVLDYLIENGSITSNEAWEQFGITRLAAVIHELRKVYNIKTVMESGLSRYGIPTRYGRYYFKGVK